MTRSKSRRTRKFGWRLARDEGGAVLIYVSIALTVFMGFAALVIDGGRLLTLDTEMQSAADALALAGAAELDGNSDAETRANAAMANLVQNDQRFATGASAITGFGARFLSVLPADSQPLSDATVSTDPADTRFVEVTLTSREVDSMFATIVGGDETTPNSAVAVAGFTSAVCKFTPLFICNPYEETDDSLSYFDTQINDPIQGPIEKRKIIALKKSGAGASYFPGNFGFLQSDLGPGAANLKDSLAKVDPGTCFVRDGVETETGNVDSARHAINTRFDLYEGSFNSKKNNSNYRPAKDVIKGYMPKSGAGGACKAAPDTNTPPTAYGFPIDSSIGSNRMGNGVWDYGKYWDINHGNRNGNYTDDPPPAGKNWNDTDPNRPSRYDVYRWEVDSSNIPNNSPTGENGNPGCNTSGISDDPDRRILYAAVLNCEALDLHGGSGDTVPALTFIKMFVTQPMTKLPGTGLTDEDNTLYVEMVDIVNPGTADEVVHDIVQLYR
ncbi:MAG: pilus assembly protein TadG-related protein [Dongiaceae bacterium]